MSDSPSPENPLIDLAGSFLPAWAKPADPSKSHAPLIAKFGDHDRDGDRRDGPRRDNRSRGDFPPRGRKPERAPGRRDEQRGRGRRDEPRRDRGPAPAPEQVLTGWTASIVPDPRGIEGLAKQLKSGGKAYALFDLVLLILEKPERYSVKFEPASDSARPLFRLAGSDTLWLSEDAAARHVLKNDLEKYYLRERVQVEPPKGAYSFIAVCGMSDTVLGPPNYHDYQTRLRRLHAEKFANVPFEVFKGRVRMVKEPEFLEKWKEEQSSKEEFTPVGTPEGTDPVKLADLKAVEQHFRANYLATLVTAVSGPIEIPGPAAIHQSDTAVRQLAQKSVLELRRFPLPLAHVVGQQLAAKGLQIFKAHENITYISVARPRHLDRQASPVAEGLSSILDYLESHPSTPRSEQWSALIALRDTPVEDAAREAAVASDLSWLIHQGHVVDYARRSLEAVKKPRPKPPTQAAPPAKEA